MKITHLTPAFAPDRGGVESHVAAVSEIQRAVGHQVAVLTKPKPHTKLATWKFVFSQWPVLRSTDLIQVHDVFWWLWPVLPLLLLQRKKIITTFHGWEGQYPVRWQAKLHRLLVSWFSTKVVHVGAWIQEFYWDKPDAVIYGGVAVTDLAALTTGSSGKSPRKLSLIFVGRLELTNDIEAYLELVQLLQTKMDCQVTWVGDGSYRKVCAKVGKVTGMVEDVELYLVTADLVLAASYLSILQAQALGKVVVALYSHRLKQRYIETYPGFSALVAGDKAEVVANQLIALLGDTDRMAKLQKQARQTAEKLSWQKVADVYQELAELK